jgi:hypothetical protein
LAETTQGESIDWSLATFEGARREQMRRWAALPLERMVAALEEMEQLAIWAASRREDDSAD